MIETKYLILNPITGIHEEVFTEEDAIDLAASIAFEFYLNQSHGNPINVLRTDLNGIETLTSFNGKLLYTITPEMRAKIAKIAKF
jgi:hypothetical protein